MVTWPKGLFTEPTAEQKRARFIADNKPAILGFAGWIVVFLYYLMVWGMVGRDPARGTIVPLYEPPDNMSPAGMRFLERMGFDQKTFTAGIMGLAAKGYLTIEQDESKTYKLVRKSKGPAESSLSGDEKTLARILFEDGSPLVLTNSKHELLSRARKNLENNLHATMEKMYFLTNGRYLWPGIVLSVLAIATMLVMGGGSRIAVALFMSVWLTGWSFGVYALVSSVIRAWRSVRTEGVLGAGQAGFLTLFSLPFLAGECVGLGMLYWACGLAAFCIIAAAIGINVLFHHLLKAPTLAGRALMDRVDGFKMFLKAVDADRLQTMIPPSTKRRNCSSAFFPMLLRLGWSMPGRNSSPMCWRRPRRRAAPAVAQAIRLPGMRARVLRRSPPQISHRALAVRFPAQSRPLLPLRDHLPARAAVVHPAAAVAAEAAEAGRRSSRERARKSSARDAAVQFVM